MELFKTWAGNTTTFVSEYSAAIGATVAGFALIALSTYAPKFVGFILKRRNGRMSKTAYKRQRTSKRLAEHKAVADGLADMLLSLHTSGKLDDAAYKRYHLYFGVEFGFSDLLPQGMTAADLKTAIKKRRNSGTWYGAYTPVKIPGPRPGERSMPLNALDAILLRHKA